MKTLPSVLAVLISLLLMTSCEKELSIENDPQSAGTLKSQTTGECLSSSANGIYKVAKALTDTNYLDVQVDVTQAGTYYISSDTMNGISFMSAGVFATTGINTVRLKGSGTPLAEGTHNVTIRYLNVSCSVAITTLAANTANSVYSFATAGDGSCTGAVLAGVYTTGTAADATNTVKLSVNVTTAGTYSIATTAVNGLVFSGSGNFTVTGVQNVTLTAAGTPATGGGFNATAGMGSSSCTFSFTVTAGTATPGVFTLGGAGSACTGFILAGAYTTGTAMAAANTAKIQVNVTTAGTFSISTAAVNGITFAASGNFTATGVQTVTLLASGTPVAAGAKTFAVTSGTASCSFDVNFSNPAAPAAFTFSGAPGACAAPIINGTYQALAALTVANTVIVKVDVTSAGSYAITTNTANGMQFSASGVFAAVGMGIAVTLTGSGTPQASETTTLAINGGCSFDLPVTTAPDGIFNCKVDGVYTSFADRSSAAVFSDLTGTPVPYLYLDGFTGPPNGDFVPELQLFINNNDNSTVNVGTYDENHMIPPGTYRIEVDLHLSNPDQSVTIWNTSSNFLPPAHPPFTIKVTSRTATHVKGTFSGKVTNTLQGSTITKTITDGVFDLPIR